MQAQSYHDFTHQLTQLLQNHPHVIGLVATGSMAAIGRTPDIYSDHDFWVITEPGHAELLRKTYDWLPPYRDIVLFFRETAHGVKLVYDDGHMLEWAVFERDELSVAAVNDYRILLGAGQLASEMNAMQTRTAKRHQQGQPPLDFLIGQVITQCLVGVGRYQRGERLSGHRFVKEQALSHLLTLIWRVLPLETDGHGDNLDPFRRLEVCYPSLADRLEGLLLLPVLACADDMLGVLAAVLTGAGEPVPEEAIAAVRGVIRI